MPISSTNPLSENDQSVSPYSNHVLISTLDSNLAQKRLIFIGDVHGALAELDSLLVELEHDPEQDHLVFTGDLIAKGPESLKVVRRVRDLGASCVRGNHDDKVIRWKGYFKSLEVEGTEFDSAKVPKEFKVGSEHEALAKELGDDLFEFLVSCPIILDIPQHDIYVVHAGLLPDKPLNEHSLFDIMNMRNVNDDGTPTKKKGKGRPWTELWNAAQEKSLNPKIVIYGHDASRGLQINKYSFGLDSGCGSGRELTAMIWNEEKKIVSVPCKSISSDSSDSS